jgi:ferrous iron transport protein A
VVAAINLNRVLTATMPGKGELVSHFADEQVASKLMAMGILPGSRIQLIRKSPFGGGWFVKVDNTYIALRKQEAACIVLK